MTAWGVLAPSACDAHGAIQMHWSQRNVWTKPPNTPVLKINFLTFVFAAAGVGVSEPQLSQQIVQEAAELRGVQPARVELGTGLQGWVLRHRTNVIHAPWKELTKFLWQKSTLVCPYLGKQTTFVRYVRNWSCTKKLTTSDSQREPKNTLRRLRTQRYTQWHVVSLIGKNGNTEHLQTHQGWKLCCCKILIIHTNDIWKTMTPVCTNRGCMFWQNIKPRIL